MSLVTLFEQKGTILDVIHMNLLRDMIHLISLATHNVKTEYVVISGKVIQESGELVGLVEEVLDRKDGLNGSLFHSSLLYDRIRNQLKQVQNQHVKQMLLATRIAVGAWPPADAVPNMIRDGCKLAISTAILVNLANTTGIWPLGDVDLMPYASVSTAMGGWMHARSTP